jgi:hypothetical protein
MYATARAVQVAGSTTARPRGGKQPNTMETANLLIFGILETMRNDAPAQRCAGQTEGRLTADSRAA